MPPCPAGTHAQKSSTVLNLVTRRRLACHILLLSFLKNHSAHLGGEKVGINQAGAPPHPPPGAGGGSPRPAPLPVPVLQGVLAQALCQEQLLLLNPPPPPLLLPPLGKRGQPQEPHSHPNRGHRAPTPQPQGDSRAAQALLLIPAPLGAEQGQERTHLLP